MGTGVGAELGEFMRQDGVEPALAELIASMATAADRIEALARDAPLAHLVGVTGATNVQGEAVHKLDEAAHWAFVDAVRGSGRAAVLVSEELAAPLGLAGGPFALYVDPIDGSSNTDVNGSLGSIFSVHAGARGGLPGPGRAQRAAGYVMYGPATSLMVTWGRGLHEFVLDPGARRFVLTRLDLRLPPHGRTYAVNTGRRAYWTGGVRAFFDDLTADDESRGRPYTLRYSGSLTADLHRILLEGGIYCYPADAKAADGKLRLLYEASPLALLTEQAGGLASTGREAILDVVPRAIHQRVPLYIGSTVEVQLAEAYIRPEGVR
jgi:fructose-1,6-bisphosphatase I